MEKTSLFKPFIIEVEEKEAAPTQCDTQLMEEELLIPFVIEAEDKKVSKNEFEADCTMPKNEMVRPQIETAPREIHEEMPINFVPATVEEAKPILSSGTIEKAATPMQIMEELIKKVSFLIVMGALYFFNGIIYELLTRERAYSLILYHCRGAVRAHGIPNIVKQIYEFIKMEPQLVCDKPDDTQHLLAFRNGVLNLLTGTFEPPSPRYFLTSYLNVEYVIGASEHCPVFEDYVSTISNGDDALYVRIWETLGYLLTQDMKAKAFVFLYGASDTGKSVFGKFLSSFFPAEAIANIDLYKLGERFSLSGLVGKRLNLCLDLPSGKLKASAISNLKLLTGGDTLTGEAKFANAFSFENTCKLVFASNHKLILPETDEAFENRIIAIPFTKVIPKEAQDKELLAKFEGERLAITMKALRFYRQLVSNNYRFSGSNHAVLGVETDMILSEFDSVRDFVENCCDFVDFSSGTFTFKLHERYLQFCESTAVYPCRDMKQFSKILHQICGEKVYWRKWRDSRYSNQPQNGYLGIILK